MGTLRVKQTLEFASLVEPLEPLWWLPGSKRNIQFSDNSSLITKAFYAIVVAKDSTDLSHIEQCCISEIDEIQINNV